MFRNILKVFFTSIGLFNAEERRLQDDDITECQLPLTIALGEVFEAIDNQDAKDEVLDTLGVTDIQSNINEIDAQEFLSALNFFRIEDFVDICIDDVEENLHRLFTCGFVIDDNADSCDDLSQDEINDATDSLVVDSCNSLPLCDGLLLFPLVEALVGLVDLAVEGLNNPGIPDYLHLRLGLGEEEDLLHAEALRLANHMYDTNLLFYNCTASVEENLHRLKSCEWYFDDGVQSCDELDPAAVEVQTNHFQYYVCDEEYQLDLCAGLAIVTDENEEI
eukprot:augustus_masked-scaffold_83-processed-gene-0.6-mRNA-1 protein AED:1.00 eAED:1.00 QI:0/0/0/0/1/1/2/0/276